MIDSTTPTTVCGCLAAPVGHGPKGSVAVPLSPFGPRRPASAMLTKPVAGVLTPEAEHEARVVARVPRPEAPRLLREPVDPFQPVVLHPGRRLGNEAGVEVKCGADPDHDRRLDAAADLRRPHLLLGLPDA